MSINCHLVKYEKDGFFDDTSKKINDVLLSEELLEFLEKNNYLKTIEIYEKKGGTKFSQKIVKGESLSENISALKKEIKKRMKNCIKNEQNSEEKEDILFNEITIFLNFYKLLCEKREQYNDNENILLTIG